MLVTNINFAYQYKSINYFYLKQNVKTKVKYVFLLYFIKKGYNRIFVKYINQIMDLYDDNKTSWSF